MIGELSQDLSTLTWVNGSDLRYGLQQLWTHVPWYRCELLPVKCSSSGIMYELDTLPQSQHLSSSYGPMMFLMPNQRYGVDAYEGTMFGPGAPIHLNAFNYVRIRCGSRCLSRPPRAPFKPVN